jgi:integrase
VQGSPSQVKGVGFRSLSCRGSWVRIPPPALNTKPPQLLDYEKYLLGRIKNVTANTYIKRLTRLGKIANLDDPAKIKTIICTYQSSEAYKELLANAYDYYVTMKGLGWEKPRFSREEKPFFLPTETEIDQLISNCRLRMSVFLQTLKETGADSGEAWLIRWTDLNTQENTVAVTPTKNHNARTLPISAHLISRLVQLPRKSSYVFGGKDIEDFRKCYCEMKVKLSVKLQNERLYRVEFRSFRHWKATNEYRKTKDILHVKWLLGHKRIENTLVYTHLVPLEKCQFVCRVAHTLEEAAALIEEGFEFVTEMDGVKLFKKPK